MTRAHTHCVYARGASTAASQSRKRESVWHGHSANGICRFFFNFCILSTNWRDSLWRVSVAAAVICVSVICFVYILLLCLLMVAVTLYCNSICNVSSLPFFLASFLLVGCKMRTGINCIRHRCHCTGIIHSVAKRLLNCFFSSTIFLLFISNSRWRFSSVRFVRCI